MERYVRHELRGGCGAIPKVTQFKKESEKNLVARSCAGSIFLCLSRKRFSKAIPISALKIFVPIFCYYPSHYGGQAHTVYRINESLDAEKFSVSVVATRFGLDSSLIISEFKKNHKVNFYKSIGPRFLLKSIQRTLEADIIHFPSLFFPPTLLLLTIAVISGKKVVLSPRGELLKPALSQRTLRKKFWIVIIKIFQKRISFHATSRAEQEAISEHFKNPKKLIDIPNLIALPPRQNIDVELKFVFVGRLNQIKNIDLLLKAFKDVGRGHPRLKLEIVGAAHTKDEVAYKRKLESFVKEYGLENVTFHGPLRGTKKDQIIASSMVLILPSKSENFGNVVLEALAQGTPVIASKNTPWEILEKKRAGFWVEANLDDLLKTMQKVLELDKKCYQEFRKNAISTSGYFDIKTKIKIWENFYKSL